MIDASDFCDRCRRFHARDRDHQDDCPSQRRVFWSRESEQRHLERQALELRHAREVREAREAREALALEREKTLAMGREVLAQQGQAVRTARQAELDRLRGEYHAYLDAQDQTRRLLRNQRIRERERGQ